MDLRDFVEDLLFIIIYIPFALAAVIYIISGGAVGEEAMITAAVLPWWLPLVAVPPLLVLVFIGLSRLRLDEYL
ncbi:hypothetical protein [Halomontanus rarus]|uniref:hypothetical protein n=1 Tax=Halomontanus rarus TaxID=3034020 RepID=UPI001A9831EB